MEINLSINGHHKFHSQGAGQYEKDKIHTVDNGNRIREQLVKAPANTKRIKFTQWIMETELENNLLRRRQYEKDKIHTVDNRKQRIRELVEHDAGIQTVDQSVRKISLRM